MKKLFIKYGLILILTGFIIYLFSDLKTALTCFGIGLFSSLLISRN